MYVCFAKPELLEMIVSHHVGARNKYGSSVKAESVLKHWAITQTPINYNYTFSWNLQNNKYFFKYIM